MWRSSACTCPAWRRTAPPRAKSATGPPHRPSGRPSRGRAARSRIAPGNSRCSSLAACLGTRSPGTSEAFLGGSGSADLLVASVCVANAATLMGVVALRAALGTAPPSTPETATSASSATASAPSLPAASMLICPVASFRGGDDLRRRHQRGAIFAGFPGCFIAPRAENARWGSAGSGCAAEAHRRYRAHPPAGPSPERWMGRAGFPSDCCWRGDNCP